MVNMLQYGMVTTEYYNMLIMVNMLQYVMVTTEYYNMLIMYKPSIGVEAVTT